MVSKKVKEEREEAKRRRVMYLKDRKHYSARNKIVIVVDDGVATGLTLRAAIHSLRQEKPKELIVAIPVAPHEFMNILHAEADKVIVLKDERGYLGAVGAYYQNFPQVFDEEVIELLNKSKK
jgi:predicted phosphoribosyltransferase